MGIGHRLKKARKSTGLTQKAVATKLGITDVTYSRYELDKRKPSFEVLEELAQIFGVDITFFFEREIDDDKNRLKQLVSEFLDSKIELYTNIRGFSHYFISSPNEDIDEIVNDLKLQYYELQVNYHDLIKQMKPIELDKIIYGEDEIVNK